MDTVLSVLNLVPRREGRSMAGAFGDMVALAQYAESLDFARYWISEHHNMMSIVSSATQVLAGHTLEHTQRIRVGSGGVMLPNHSPLMVAEQYGTLAEIYPGRVDLGLGRAPGTDQITAAALRRQANHVFLNFPDDVRELQRYLDDADKQGVVKAYPGVGTHIPLYILGSSTESAYLAAELGLPYAFAGHFAPRFLREASAVYREKFQASAVLQKPYFILCVNLAAAQTEDEARFLYTTQQQTILGMIRNRRGFLPPPVEDMHKRMTPQEADAVERFAVTLLGAPEHIRAQVRELYAQIPFDELMAVSYIYDTAKQHEAYRIFKEAVQAA